MEGRTFLLHPFSLALLLSLFVFSFCALISSFNRKRSEIAYKQELVDSLAFRASKASYERGDQDLFIREFQGADPYYFEQVLETTPFLVKEIEALKSIKAHPAFEKWQNIDERLKFLESKANRLQFSESVRRSHDPLIEESEAHLIHPIELDRSDLKHLMTLIEGIKTDSYEPSLHRPQLLFKKFDLKRGKAFSSKEVYTVDMQVIKREVKK